MHLTAWPVRNQPPRATWTALCRPGGEVCAGEEGAGEQEAGGLRERLPRDDEVRVQEHPPETERILGGDSDPAGVAAGTSGGVITGSSSVLRGL